MIIYQKMTAFWQILEELRTEKQDGFGFFFWILQKFLKNSAQILFLIKIIRKILKYQWHQLSVYCHSNPIQPKRAYPPKLANSLLKSDLKPKIISPMRDNLDWKYIKKLRVIKTGTEKRIQTHNTYYFTTVFRILFSA